MMNRKIHISALIIIVIGCLFLFIKSQQNQPVDALKHITMASNIHLIKDNSKAIDLYIANNGKSNKYLGVAFLKKNLFGKWKIINQAQSIIKENNTGYWGTFHFFSNDQYTVIGIIDPEIKKVYFNKTEAIIYSIPTTKYRVFVYKYKINEIDGNFEPKYIPY
jgi:hypothetical protein